MGDLPTRIREAAQQYEASLDWWAEKCEREKARAEQAEQMRDKLAERLREAHRLWVAYLACEIAFERGYEDALDAHFREALTPTQAGRTEEE